MAKQYFWQRKGKRTHYNATNPNTGKRAICVKIGFIYSWADHTWAYSWNVHDAVEMPYVD